MRKNCFFFIVAEIFLFNCNSTRDCVGVYEKFVEYKFKGNDNLAIDYIDKAIDCDKDNSDYKYEKIKLLVENEKYIEAFDVAKSISIQPAGYLIQGVLELKMNKGGSVALKKAYELLQENTHETNIEAKFLRDFNLIQLIYYFEGKEVALDSLLKCEENYSEEYQRKTLGYLRSLIDANQPEEVLFRINNMY